MKLKDYQSWAITKKADDLTEREAKLTWALGLVDEAVEVWQKFFYGFGNRLDILDELGDVTWYAAVLADAYHIDIQALEIRPMLLGAGIVQANHLVTTAKAIGEMVKKDIGHGHMISRKDVQIMLAAIFSTIDQLSKGLNQADSGLQDILQLNYDKLEKRYPGGFNPEASQQRYE